MKYHTPLIGNKIKYKIAGVIVHGGIRANGREVDLSYMRHHSGFMHQEDVFIGTMTVSEHLWFMVLFFEIQITISLKSNIIYKIVFPQFLIF